jgi:hypothetical protein
MSGGIVLSSSTMGVIVTTVPSGKSIPSGNTIGFPFLYFAVNDSFAMIIFS